MFNNSVFNNSFLLYCSLRLYSKKKGDYSILFPRFERLHVGRSQQLAPLRLKLCTMDLRGVQVTWGRKLQSKRFPSPPQITKAGALVIINMTVSINWGLCCECPFQKCPYYVGVYIRSPGFVNFNMESHSSTLSTNDNRAHSHC